MPFVKGQSGNPGGRPKKDFSWSRFLTEVGEEIEPKSKKQFKELVAKRLWVEAVNGNLGAIRELLNRIEGMPVQKNILAGDEDNPLQVDIGDTLKKIYGRSGDKSTGGVSKDST